MPPRRLRRAARLAWGRRRRRTPLGARRRHHHRAAGGDDDFHRAAMGGDAALARRDDRPAHPSRHGRVRRKQSRNERCSRRQGDRAPRRPAIFVRAAMHRRSRGNARHVPRHEHGRRARLHRRHDQRERHAGAGLRGHVHHDVSPRRASTSCLATSTAAPATRRCGRGCRSSRPTSSSRGRAAEKG